MKTLLMFLIVAVFVANAYRTKKEFQDEMAPKVEKRGCTKKFGKCTSDSQCCDEKNWSGRKLRCLTQCDEGGCLKYNQCLFYAGIQKRDEMAPKMEKRGCTKKWGKCTSDSQCCDEKNWSGRKLRCLTQCDEGGCLKYNQCLFYAGIQKK